MAYYDLTQPPTDSGAANSWNAVYSKTLPAGSVNADNAFILRADLQAASSAGVAKVRVKMNGVTLWTLDALMPQAALSLEVWRTGSNSGRYVARLAYDTGITQNEAQWRGDVPSGLSWSSGQALVIEGFSDVSGGVVLRGAGVLK